MAENSDILRLPPTNKKLGSCPECGKPVWESDAYRQMGRLMTYICVECRTLLTTDMIIPF